MKIDSASISPVGSVQAATRVSQISKVNTVSQQDQLAVSENAQVFQKLLQKIKDMPDIREDKVTAISEQIANCEFNLDAASIAEGILSPNGMEGK
ncbi:MULTISPECIES: flagellar biosynthesis anti-sigma factor FlgM [Dehalobacter]|jgi:negative regulator of flagellin synthesis FlgM|uniref:Negative regulator of flagellin synthesis n=2 Tax=Dehalobacter restrictus TaxID=55583 RepID=A0A857DLK1_9FIRM|nr:MULTISPECIES: flagellar biosynthesis anti-sigma factor FlgM [Dehalobacter]AHF10639.1 flagellar biosynthesis anti-sigma factor protein FlgM [Dehalobacter restrictus DSM 9455]MCG1026389.1 flagellar biosynthesis anti-sigma factor FlgM [Dehalobacter sp.]MDJ0306203.1 flagellar biosynthesis anti-sigma factor FlgM [Dehalobacter sp.]OCZ54628.1 flagellar biosynthesis anti-sigma factor FlgM [Dehalobacter sp. TeCB1]QHA01265.1 flagellar biosynthesis anti-sigma factor FlgM [Dehalobacter restrictus]